MQTGPVAGGGEFTQHEDPKHATAFPTPIPFRSKRPSEAEGCRSSLEHLQQGAQSGPEACEGWRLESGSPLAGLGRASGSVDRSPPNDDPVTPSGAAGAPQEGTGRPPGPWGSPAPAGPRWCGNLGPSLYMTAVERQTTADRGRAELERMGRHSRRVASWSAEQRARNDLPPREDLAAALWAPSGRFADLLREGLAEGLEHGDKATRQHCAAHQAGLGRHGLDPSLKSAHAPRPHGWKGLTTAGRRAIRDAGSVMEQWRGTLGFWTVTLPPAAADVATREQIATFQSRLLFFTRRAMVRAGLQPLALLVAELHPHRRTMGGDRIPHWHLIVQVRRERSGRWLIPVAGWHRIIDQAHRAAFNRPRGATWGCKMLPGKTSAARYLAPYMAKDKSNVSELENTRAGRMVPRQWWTWTGELRAAVMACRIRPPSGFLRWCCRWWRELEEYGDLARTELVQIGEDGPIVGRWFVWSSEAALDQAIEAWIGEELARLESTGPP